MQQKSAEIFTKELYASNPKYRGAFKAIKRKPSDDGTEYADIQMRNFDGNIIRLQEVDIDAAIEVLQSMKETV